MKEKIYMDLFAIQEEFINSNYSKQYNNCISGEVSDEINEGIRIAYCDENRVDPTFSREELEVAKKYFIDKYERLHERFVEQLENVSSGPHPPSGPSKETFVWLVYYFNIHIWPLCRDWDIFFGALSPDVTMTVRGNIFLVFIHYYYVNVFLELPEHNMRSGGGGCSKYNQYGGACPSCSIGFSKVCMKCGSGTRRSGRVPNLMTSGTIFMQRMHDIEKLLAVLLIQYEVDLADHQRQSAPTWAPTSNVDLYKSNTAMDDFLGAIDGGVVGGFGILGSLMFKAGTDKVQEWSGIISPYKSIIASNDEASHLTTIILNSLIVSGGVELTKNNKFEPIHKNIIYRVDNSTNKVPGRGKDTYVGAHLDAPPARPAYSSSGGRSIKKKHINDNKLPEQTGGSIFDSPDDTSEEDGFFNGLRAMINTYLASPFLAFTEMVPPDLSQNFFKWLKTEYDNHAGFLVDVLMVPNPPQITEPMVSSLLAELAQQPI